MKKALTLILLVILVAGGSWFGYAAWSDNKEPAATKKTEANQNSENETDAEVATKEEKQPQEKTQEQSPEPKDEEVEQPTQPAKEEEQSPEVEADKGKEESPNVEVEKEEPQSQPEKQDLNSTWSIRFPGTTGTLAISNATPDSFDFALDIETGDDPGEIDGTATIEGNSAKFIDSEFNTGCVLTFSLNGESIDISQGNGCEQFHGQATKFEGTYYKD